MTGLVLEGGTFRGIFSAGIMDAFLKENVEFPYVIGVSAGISNAYSYISKQYERNIDILENYRNDKRYLSKRNFLKCGSYFGLEFVFGEIPNNLIPFDQTVFRAYNGTAIVGVTNAKTGKIEYLNALEDDEKFSYIRASCAIPGFFPAIKINGGAYYDGGISSPICVKKALSDGCEKVVIILTRPKGFVKELGKGNIAMSQLVKAKYPKMEMALLTRHRLYNTQVAFCEELERRGKALILRPQNNLVSFEKDERKLRAAWQEGFDLAYERLDEIKQIMGGQ